MAKQGAGGRTEAVLETLRARLASRTLGPGDRLPSIRAFAAVMKVSPSTIVEAYDRLTAEGLIRPRRGAGFYVVASNAPPLALGSAGVVDRAVDPFWVSRQTLDTDRGVLKPGCGWLPADWLPQEALRRALRAASRADEAILTDYGPTRGSLTLRRLLLARFAEEGIEASPDQLCLTASGSQAVDLICRYLLRPGDVVMVDDPCYFNFRALLRAHQVEIIGVPYLISGPDLARFESMLIEKRPRLYITNCGLHNPTGATMTPQTAHRLLNLAAAHDLSVVEDDIFADFEPDLSPRLSALDGLNRVIRIGSFSKTLSASVRCGYIAGRADWVEDLVDLQVASSFGGPSPLAAEILTTILSSGAYRRHLDELRRRLAGARSEVAGRLSALGIEPWLMPRGGFYLWCRLPGGCSAADLARSVLPDGIVLAPGDVFSVGENAPDLMRFNVGQCSDARLWTVLRRALDS
ncbi:MAG: PLP-dependent aminotransferase family protein [Mesorhizobium sp.]